MGVIDEGQEAQRVLDSTAFRAAVQRLNERYHNEWAATDPVAPGEAEKRERLFLKVSALHEVRQELQSAVDAAKIQQKREHAR